MWNTNCLLFLAALSSTKISQAFLAPTVASPLSIRYGGATSLRAGVEDTPETLPDFETAQEYLEYLESVSALPQGFATGTADGTFVSVEAPSLGDLKIRGTVIHVTSGPTDNWAACYTSNKVSIRLH